VLAARNLSHFHQACPNAGSSFVTWLPSKQLLRPPAPCLMTTSRPLWGIISTPPFRSHAITRATGPFRSKFTSHPQPHDRSSREWLAQPSEQHFSQCFSTEGRRASHSVALTALKELDSRISARTSSSRKNTRAKHCHPRTLSLDSCVLLSNMMEQISPVRSLTTPIRWIPILPMQINTHDDGAAL
jgi:hypothetical protein